MISKYITFILLSMYATSTFAEVVTKARRFESLETENLSMVKDGFDVIFNVTNDGVSGHDSFIFMGPDSDPDYHAITADNNGGVTFTVGAASKLTLATGTGPNIMANTLRVGGGSLTQPSISGNAIDNDTGINFTSTGQIDFVMSGVLYHYFVGGQMFLTSPGSTATMNILAATATGSDSVINMGSVSDIDQGQIRYDDSLNIMAFMVNNNASVLTVGETLMVKEGDIQAGDDFIGGDDVFIDDAYSWNGSPDTYMQGNSGLIAFTASGTNTFDIFSTGVRTLGYELRLGTSGDSAAALRAYNNGSGSTVSCQTRCAAFGSDCISAVTRSNGVTTCGDTFGGTGGNTKICLCFGNDQ